MNSDEFWLKAQKYLLILIITIATLVLANCQASKYQIVQAIKAGATPQEAACALHHGSVTDDAICVMLVAKK